MKPRTQIMPTKTERKAVQMFAFLKEIVVALYEILLTLWKTK